MTSADGHRILDAVRYGGVEASEALVTLALRATGDAKQSDDMPSTTFSEEWQVLRAAGRVEVKLMKWGGA